MGCGGKPSKPIQPPQSIVILQEPKFDENHQSCQQKLEYLLKEEITKYIIEKNTNYLNVTMNLCQQMKMSITELQESIKQLQTFYQTHNWVEQDLVHLINSIKELMKQSQNSHLQFQKEWKDQDFQHQLLFFQFLVDVKHIADTISTKPNEQWWSLEYLEKYSNNKNSASLVIKAEKSIQQQPKPLYQVQRILEAFQQYFSHQVAEIQKQIQIKEEEARELRLNTLKTLPDDVISKANNDDLEIKINYVRQQNQKYATPI